jgi:hypothetical protein
MLRWKRFSELANRLFLSSLLLSLAAIAWGQTQIITASDFGMQCGSTSITGITNCAPVSGAITLPTQPGMLRLWDSGVSWADIQPTSATAAPQWGTLNEYLQAIGTDPTHPSVIYTFGHVPCWAVASCSSVPWTPIPPDDLFTSCSPICSKSADFDAFVQLLTSYCYTNPTTSQTYCVKDLIKYYELWNEADTSIFWDPPTITGLTSSDILYDMVSPEASVITTNVTGAQLLTPSITGNGESWMVDWVCSEGTNTLISSYYDIHQYMYLGTSSAMTITPEAAYQKVVPGTSGSPGTLYPNYNPTPTGGCPNGKTNHWAALPWMLTETNWAYNSGLSPAQYACTVGTPPSGYYQADCDGQLVRWQLLLNSPLSVNSTTVNGAANVSWYWWDQTIGDYPGGSANYAEPYYYMQQYMLNGKLNGVCASSSGVISCPFKQSYGHPPSIYTALWVWTNDMSSGGLPFAFSGSTYASYWDLWGGCHAISPSTTSITATYDPVMLTARGCM